MQEVTTYKSFEEDAAKKDITMAKTAAEGQREYRARRNADPERREKYLRSERERWRKDTEAGKKRSINNLSERAKRNKRKMWRDAKKRQKQREALFRNISTPSESPDNQYAEQPRSESSRQYLEGKKHSRRTSLYKEIEKLKYALKKEKRLKEKYKKWYQRSKKQNISPRSKVRELVQNCSVNNKACETEPDGNTTEDTDGVPSAVAEMCLLTSLKWLEQQREALPKHLQALRELHALAVRKRESEVTLPEVDPLSWIRRKQEELCGGLLDTESAAPKLEHIKVEVDEKGLVLGSGLPPDQIRAVTVSGEHIKTEQDGQLASLNFVGIQSDKLKCEPTEISVGDHNMCKEECT